MINAYTIMMAVILLLGLLMRGNRAGNWKYVWLSCLLMFCILGLRDISTIGNDSRTSYLWTFRGLANRDLSQILQEYSFENNSGFFVLMKLIHMLTDGDYQLFVIIISAFIMLVFAHFINRYSPDPMQSFCYYWGLLLYLFMFSAQKQALAMTFVLLAFDAILKRKLIRYLFFVFLAVQFHYPALVFLPAYWLPLMKPGKHLLLIYAAAILLTFVFRDQILTFMMNGYEDDTGSTYSLGGATFFRTKSLIMLIIVLSAVVLRPPSAEDQLYLLLIEFTAIAVLFQTFCAFNNIFERLADYYFQFSVVLIPMVFDRNAETRSLLPARTDEVVKTVAPFLFSGFGIWRMADMILTDAAHFLPFRFYFE